MKRVFNLHPPDCHNPLLLHWGLHFLLLPSAVLWWLLPAPVVPLLHVLHAPSVSSAWPWGGSPSHHPSGSPYTLARNGLCGCHLDPPASCACKSPSRSLVRGCHL